MESRQRTASMMLLLLFILGVDLYQVSAQLQWWQPETAWTRASWSTVRLPFPYKEVLSGSAGVDQVGENIEFSSNIGPDSIAYYQENVKASNSEPDDVQAWRLLKCTVCSLLPATVWEMLRLEFHISGALPSYERILETLKTSCHAKVLINLQADTDTRFQTHMRKFQPYKSSICERMLQTPPGFSVNPMARNIRSGFQTYAFALNKQLAPSLIAGANRIPQKGLCEDFHPECPRWASIGECEKNPGYMMNEKSGGYCHFSCGMCLLPFQKGDSLGLDKAASFSTQAQQSVQTHTCKAMKMCEGVDASLVPMVFPVQTSTSDLASQGRKSESTIEKTESKWQISPEGLRELEEGEKKFATKTTCYKVNMGWWTYEYCHRRHFHQIHFNNFGIAMQTIVLGKTIPGDPRKQELDQVEEFPTADGANQLQAFYKIKMTEGDLCDLDTGGQVHREAEILFTCSFKEQNLVTIDETAQCRYRLVLYDKAFCISEENAKILPTEHDEL